MATDRVRTLVLGAGYVGARLLAMDPSAVGTHRADFDLHDSTTWANLPDAERVVITFPLEPVSMVRQWANTYLRNPGQTVIALGSTSRYLVSEPGAWVTEESPIDQTQRRVQGEEYLRSRGATVLVLAGIWGPDRNPLDWVARGLISDGNRWVNLVHVDEIVSVTHYFLEHPLRGENINLSDGVPKIWSSVVPSLPASRGAPSGKRVSIEKLRRLLPTTFHFRSWAAELITP